MAFFIGLFIVLFSGVPLMFGLWSYSWQQADGVITYSKPHNFARWYEVDVRYKYNYRGQGYSGDRYRYRFIIDRPESSEVDRVQARYPVGEKVRVAVNPSYPAQSVLQAGVEWTDFFWPPLSLLFFIAAFRIDRKQQPGEQPVRKQRFSTATVLFVIGAGLFLYGANTLAIAWRSTAWPTVDGKVFHASKSARLAVLWYEYHVQGTRYVAENLRVSEGNWMPSDDAAKDVARRYPAGTVVKVYYNPNDPSYAVLEPGAWYGNFVFPAIGAIVFFCAWFTKKLAAAMRR